ncbi:hypothetical protein VTN02DRAFT_5245 [Thermoascus thermophilus]
MASQSIGLRSLMIGYLQIRACCFQRGTPTLEFSSPFTAFPPLGYRPLWPQACNELLFDAGRTGSPGNARHSEKKRDPPSTTAAMTNCWRAGLIRAIASSCVAAVALALRLAHVPRTAFRSLDRRYLRHHVLPFGGDASQTLIYIPRRVGERVAFVHRLTPSGHMPYVRNGVGPSDRLFFGF